MIRFSQPADDVLRYSTASSTSSPMAMATAIVLMRGRGEDIECCGQDGGQDRRQREDQRCAQICR